MATALTATLRADITQFERAIAQAETKISGLQRSTTQVNRELAKFGNDFGGATLIRQANSMAKAVEDIGGVTKLTTAEQRKLAGTVDEALAKYRALGQEVPPKLVAVSTELHKIRTAQEAAEKSAKELAAAQLKAAGATTTAFKDAGGAGSALIKGLRSFGPSLAATFSVGAVISFGKEIVDLGSQITDLSQRMGVGVEAAQEINFALEQTGSSAEGGARAIAQMSDRLTEGKTGTVAALKSLNLEINTLRSLKPEDAFTAIAEQIKRVPDPMRQTQLAMELFGKAGVEILPAIKQGMGDLREEARKLGQVLSEEDVKALDRFGDLWDEQMKRMKVSAASAILDVVDAFKQSWKQILADQWEALQSVGPLNMILPGVSILPGLQRSGKRTEAAAAEDKLKDLGTDVLRRRSGAGAEEAAARETAAALAAALANNAKAADDWAKAVRAAIDKATGADAQRQIKLLSDAYAGLTTDQKQNGEIVRRLLEPYEALRRQVKALPPEIEKAREQFAPLPSRNLFTSTVTGMMQIVQAAPAMLNTTQQTKNLLNGLRADGLLPTTNAWVGYAEAVDASAVKSRPLQTALVEGKTHTIAWADSITGLSRSFADLAQIGGEGLDGMIGQIAEMIGLMGIGAQAGQQLAQQFRNKDAKGNIIPMGQSGAGFNLSSFRSDGGEGGYTVGSVAGGAAAAAPSVVAAYGALDQATNVKGRGARAGRGAIAGAAIGAQVAGPYGALVGLAVGALVGALRNPAFEDVFHRVAKNFGVEISDETAKAIAKMAKDTFKGDRAAAEIFSLDTIIGEGGGLKKSNIDQLTSRLRDAFSMASTGKFDADQLTEVLTKNYGNFADFVGRSNEIAGKGFAEIARLAKQAGVDVESTHAFVGEQTGRVGGGLADLAGPLFDAAGLSEQIKAAEAAQKAAAEAVSAARGGKSDDELGVGDRQAIDAAQKAQEAASQALADITAKMAGSTKDAQAEFDRLGIIAVGAFNAARASGLGYLEAVDQLSPGLDRMNAIQEQLGLTGNAAFDELSKFRDLVSGNETLVASAEALNETILGLSNIGGLTVETLAAMEGQGVQTFERLTAAGFTSGQSIEIMRGFIENLEKAHEQLGVPIDANTQALIDQARAMEGLGPKDPSAALTKGFENVVTAVDRLARGLGIDVPAAANAAAGAVEGATQRASAAASASADVIARRGGEAFEELARDATRSQGEVADKIRELGERGTIYYGKFADKAEDSSTEASQQLERYWRNYYQQQEDALRDADSNLNGFVDQANDALDQIQRKIEIEFHYSQTGELPSGGDVPGLGTGGVVRARAGGTIVRLGEGGRDEAVIPLGSGSGQGVSLPMLVEALSKIQFTGTLEGGGRPLLRYVSREVGDYIQTRTGQRVPI